MRIKFLIDLKESSFQAFDFQTLKPQTPPASIQVASRHLPSLSQERNVAVTATFYPIDMSRLTVLDLKKDTSLVLYTVTKKWRPWIGLYVELSDDGNYVTVQWVKKEKQNYILHLKNDGSPYLSSVPVQSIMFADVLENLCLEDSREGPYKMLNFVKSEIANAYIERDKNLDGS